MILEISVVLSVVSLRSKQNAYSGKDFRISDGNDKAMFIRNNNVWKLRSLRWWHFPATIAILAILSLAVVYIMGRPSAILEDDWDNQISAIKRGSRTQATVCDVQFLERLAAEPTCRETIEGIYIRSFYSYPAPDSGDTRWQLLRQFCNLRTIRIGALDRADAFLRCIEGMKGVESVTLYSTSISGTGMQYIATLPDLKELNLYAADVSNDGLAAVRGHPTLDTIRMIGKSVTEDDLAVLNEIPKLRSVVIQDTAPISERGFEYLKRLTSLKELRLGGWNRDAKEILDLQQALPGCKVHTRVWSYD